MHLTPRAVLSRCRAGFGYVILAASQRLWLVRSAEFAIQAAAGAAVLAHFASYFAWGLELAHVFLLSGCLCGPKLWSAATAEVWSHVAPRLPAALRTYLATWRRAGLSTGERAPEAHQGAAACGSCNACECANLPTAPLPQPPGLPADASVGLDNVPPEALTRVILAAAFGRWGLLAHKGCAPRVRQGACHPVRQHQCSQPLLRAALPPSHECLALHLLWAPTARLPPIRHGAGAVFAELGLWALARTIAPAPSSARAPGAAGQPVAGPAATG